MKQPQQLSVSYLQSLLAASRCLGGTTGLVQRFPCHFQLKSSSSNLVCPILLAQYHGAWKRCCVKSLPPLLSCASFAKNACTCVFLCRVTDDKNRKKGEGKTVNLCFSVGKQLLISQVVMPPV